MTDKTQLLIFALDGRHYALRLSQVEHVLRAVDSTPLPEAPPIVLGVIDLHGMIVPVLNIRKRFGFAEREVAVDDQFIIARTSKRTVALAVDHAKEIIEHAAGDITDTTDILPHVEQITGVIQLEDDLIFIHDLDRFLSLDEEQLLEQASGRKLIRGN